ncbi:M36 family metallopeptidase [Chryseobacterium koreense]|uniref:M36 family metallopeptidase n=1 Tax=Chryseobacterium koreense TaxID=232216 RepID=UPI0026E9B33F|nr:M36 family metallopeptidase [Chryseobacterium koreense]
MKKQLILVLVLVMGISKFTSQTPQKLRTATASEIYNFLQKSDKRIKFSDVENLKVTDSHKSINSEITHLYYKQTLNGIPIFNSSVSVAVKDGQIRSVASSLIGDLNHKKAKSKIGIPENQIEEKAAENLGYILIYPGKNGKPANKKMKTPAPELVYFLTKNDELVLSYQTVIRVNTEKGGQTFLAIADASSGEVLKKMNTTLSCDFDNHTFSNSDREIRKELQSGENNEIEMLENQAKDGTIKYNVYPFPLESPLSGNRSTVVDPSDPDASLFGWHSENDLVNEYSFTAGNNTYTMYDHDGQKYMSYHDGYWPEFDNFIDGGADFNFDFPLDLNLHPYENKEAITTNLFYMNNVLHDIFYRYGFDEAAGNFQVYNYTGEGVDNDLVLSLAQTGVSQGRVNNASFELGNDGYPALMSMFLWTPFGSYAPLSIDLLEIYTNGSLKGKYKGRVAVFGPMIQNPPMYADLAIMKDTNSVGNDSYDGCDAAINPTEIQNKLAVIRRGTCSFYQKVFNAQNAGAKGVIMVNNVEGEPVEMGGVNSGEITIPSIMISKTNGEAIISALQTGPLSGSIPAENTAIPQPRDSSLDNGIISHEFGHGVSSRLTGGADNWCLTNLEQMGEGWSDFFGLLFTMKSGDKSTDARGAGNYVSFRNPGDIGIRPTAYSTDMTINPATYDTLKTYDNTESPHRLGYVWATMLWELNWNMINKYGFDPNIETGNGGNNKTLQLVMEGLKLQPCTPGFVDGRDAILQADELLYDGANRCEIWKAFSKRGLGYYANQGSVEDRTDGTANFDMPPAEILDCSQMAVNEIEINMVKIFPNPTTGIINITAKENLNDIAVSLWDASGRTLKTEKLKMTETAMNIDISDKPAGIYILRVVTPKGGRSFKVVKK